MSNTLMLPEGVDKLSLPQKVVALGLLGGAAYFVVPFLIAMMVNLWIAAILAIPILYVAYNPMLVWGVFKTLSQKSTDWIIGLSPLSAMDRYLDWVKMKHRSITSAKLELMAAQQDINNQITEKENSYKQLMKKALHAEDKGEEIQASSYAENAASDKEFLENLIPVRDDVKNKLDYLSELDEVFDSNTKKLSYKIDNLKQRYKLIKTTHKGMKSANAVIGESGDAQRMFNVALQSANDDMNKMTANIQQYEQNIKPMLTGAKFDKELRQGEARKLLDEFRKANAEL